ncbi:MAG: protein translocase subunit SecF, partial [Minisyncoccia bacterium]
MFVVKYRKIFFALSIALIVVSAYGFFTYGLKYSIDFKGGTITELAYDKTLPA